MVRGRGSGQKFGAGVRGRGEVTGVGNQVWTKEPLTWAWKQSQMPPPPATASAQLRANIRK